MNTLILFLDDEDADWTLEGWWKQSNVHHAFELSDTKSYISFDKDEDTFSDYNEEEEKFIREFIKKPVCYVVTWRGDQLINDFVKFFPDDKIAIVDNDYGMICELSKLKGHPVQKWIYSANFLLPTDISKT